MCNCLTDLKDPQVWQKGDKKPTAVDIKIGHALARDEQRRWFGVTTTEIRFTFEGRKTPVKDSLPHNYCPWCGEKYGYVGKEVVSE